MTSNYLQLRIQQSVESYLQKLRERRYPPSPEFISLWLSQKVSTSHEGSDLSYRFDGYILFNLNIPMACLTHNAEGQPAIILNTIGLHPDFLPSFITNCSPFNYPIFDFNNPIFDYRGSFGFLLYSSTNFLNQIYEYYLSVLQQDLRFALDSPSDVTSLATLRNIIVYTHKLNLLITFFNLTFSPLPLTLLPSLPLRELDLTSQETTSLSLSFMNSTLVTNLSSLLQLVSLQLINIQLLSLQLINN